MRSTDGGRWDKQDLPPGKHAMRRRGLLPDGPAPPPPLLRKERLEPAKAGRS